MKSILCSVLIGFFLVTVFKFSRITAVLIDSTTQNEINRLYHVRGSMGGNITLTSNSSLGDGAFGFVLAGETNDGTPVAIKATLAKYLKSYKKEYECYEKMNATSDKVCEKYGIPFIYHSGDFLNYKTVAMSMLDVVLISLKQKIGLFSHDSIVIIFRDMIKTLKFLLSKGIIHKDVHYGNIMIKGANVFLIDFNCCKSVANFSNWNPDPIVYHDMLSLFTVMTSLINTTPNKPMFCRAENILKNYDKLSEEKQKMKKEFVLENKEYTELVEPYAEFCFEVIDAMREKRLPKYDYLYKMFDDILYTGRNRSERIVFEWLTPEERAAAIAESPPSIESIVFPEKNIY